MDLNIKDLSFKFLKINISENYAQISLVEIVISYKYK